MPGQTFHLVSATNFMSYYAPTYFEKLSDEERREFILGSLIVDTVTPIVGGRWFSHFVGTAGWKIPETFEIWKENNFEIKPYGNGPDSYMNYVVDPETDFSRLLVQLRPHTPFQNGYLFHILIDYFNQIIRYKENFEWDNESGKIKLKLSNEMILEKDEFKKRAQGQYPAEDQHVANTYGMSEKDVLAVKEFLRVKLPENLFNPTIEKYLRYDSSLELPENNPFVTEEQINRIVAISCETMETWVITGILQL